MKYLADAGDEAGKFPNPLKGGVQDLPGLISALLDIVVKLGAVVIVFYFIYSGYLFVTAQGDPKKLETAKTNFLYVAIGTVILLGAKALAVILQGTVDEVIGK